VDEYDKWFTVGIFKGLTHTVSKFIDFDEWNTLDASIFNSDNLPELETLKQVNLEPGRAYRFRIAGINACGRGEWSEVGANKLSL
jgi:host cell factor